MPLHEQAPLLDEMIRNDVNAILVKVASLGLTGAHLGKSIGALRPSEMSAALYELISARTGIPPRRIFIGFEDVPASSWGWNGKTFG